MAYFRAKSAIKDPLLRKFVKRVMDEYRKSGSAAGNENLKHVLRMTREVRTDLESLIAIGCEPGILEAAILLSDLGKEPHIQKKYLPDYGGNPFRAFLDHCRISMREGNIIRKEVGLSSEMWRKILSALIGHDGPSIVGSWWKANYERELKKKYAAVHGREALIHCYLDRIDQGAVFKNRSGQLNGGLRKISYNIYTKDSPVRGNLAGTIAEIFGNTRMGTQDQLDYLDEVLKPRFLDSTPLPKIVREMKRKFLEVGKYFERVLIDPAVTDSVRIVLDQGENVEVKNLDDFWHTLSKVTPKDSTSAFGRRVHTV